MIIWSVGGIDRGSGMSTEVPEIQDVQGPKSMATRPTAQTAEPNKLKFFMEALQEDSFRGTEAIFEFPARSRDNELFKGHFGVFSDPPKGPKTSMNIPNISSSKMKFKNRLGAPETILLKGFHEKFEPIRSSGLGCRGGYHRFYANAHFVFRALL